MINTQAFGAMLKSSGFTFFTGVPCSFLKYLINYALNECEFIMAPNEGDAVAIASGANLGGRKAVVLMQNSGLTNATSPLTSLNFIFKIPVLGFVSLRGAPKMNDEPQHELMGNITTTFLDSMQVGWDYLSSDFTKTAQQLQTADAILKTGKSFFFVVNKDTFDPVSLKFKSNRKFKPCSETEGEGQRSVPTRTSALRALSEVAGEDTFIVATTGFTGRELFEERDRPENIYMVGSMGCAPAFALGLALSQPKKRFIIIDGDGALLMRMGALPTLGYYRPPNLLHLLLDNQVHESTGGQFTVSGAVDWVAVAGACGYPRALRLHRIEELNEGIIHWKESSELTFMTLKTAPGEANGFGRPALKPAEVAERFRKRISKGNG